MKYELMLLEQMKKNVLEARPFDNCMGWGICSNLWETKRRMPHEHQYKLGFALNNICQHMTKWPLATDYDSYPVPASHGDSSYQAASQKYYMAQDDLSMWDKTTEYGQLRWELLEWLISEYSK